MQYRLSTLFLVFFVVAASLAAFGLWGIWFGGMICIAALALNRTKVLYPNGVMNCICTIFFGIVCSGSLIALVAVYGVEEVKRANCIGLHSGIISLDLLNYYDAHKSFPSVYTRDKQGQPLFNWTVEILEYEENYGKLNKDEPWNSSHNAKVLSHVPDEYVCPSVKRDPKDLSSNFMAIIGPGTIWKEEGAKIKSDFQNGTSHTIVAVEVVDSGKHWAEPFAITVDEVLENMKNGKSPRISTVHPKGVQVLFADGCTRSFPTKMPLSLWRKILNGESDFDYIESGIYPNADDMVDVYVGPKTSFFEKISIVLSIAVWLASATWLIYRAFKSRKVNFPASADAG